MTPEQVAIYHRARAAGLRAIDAVRTARWAPEPMPDTLDGFDLRMTDEPDCGLSLADIGYGEFVAGEHYSAHPDWTQRPHPDAVPNPYRDSRGASGGAEWYIPAVTVRESAAHFHKAGASRSVALDMAREMVADEVRRLANDWGPDVRVVIVTASRAGIDLGSATCGSVEIAWDTIRRTSGEEYLHEVARELMHEAVAEARDALARLVAA